MQVTSLRADALGPSRIAPHSPSEVAADGRPGLVGRLAFAKVT
jgi:hypothetical protein